MITHLVAGCLCRYLDLDVFKLDVIARELKGLEKEISRCKSAVAGVDVKSMTNFSDREKMSAALFPLVDVLNMCRTHMRDVINQCLTETQKLHIGRVGCRSPCSLRERFELECCAVCHDDTRNRNRRS